MYRHPPHSRRARRAPYSVRRARRPSLADLLWYGLDGEYPFFSEARFRRQRKRHPEDSLSDAFAFLDRDAAAYLFASETHDLLEQLDLHPVDRAIVHMRMGGFSLREIARETGLKKCRIEKAMKCARSRHLEVKRGKRPTQKYAGWQQVYLSEMRRSGCRGHR